MKIKEERDVPMAPKDIDEACVQLYYTLNRLPSIETFESCCGHLKSTYDMFFHCDSIGVLTRLGRAVNKNYSDGNLELIVDSVDATPYGCFWLRSTKVFSTDEEMNNSVNNLIGSILYWFDDKFDNHFDTNNWVSQELQPGKTGNFGQAIQSLKNGKLVARKGWNGKGMFIFMRPGDRLDDNFIVKNVKSVPEKFKTYVIKNMDFDSSTYFTPYLCMKAADGTVVNGWLASQTDMLSEDWELVDII